MAEITASLVKELRESTGVGMMECKKALQETGGDLDKAAQLLREKGAAKAVKRASRATSEGRIAARESEDRRAGVIVEVNIETDFAARNENFGKLVEVAADTALEARPADLEALLAAKPVGADSADVKTLVTDTIAVIGENMGVGRVAFQALDEVQPGLVHTYIHPPGKVGVVLTLKTDSDAVAAKPEALELAHDLCLHIAFSNPAGLDPSSIPAEVVEKEKEIYRNAAIQEGKPEKILDKIVEGKVKAFYKESCLIEQGFVKDDKKSISQLIDEVAKAAGGSIEIAAYERFQLGESG